jgi:hypothetical protein
MIAPNTDAAAAGILCSELRSDLEITGYPDNTPDKVVDQAMAAIKEAGGMS